MFVPRVLTVALLVWTHRWPSPVPVLPAGVCGCVGGWVCEWMGVWGDGCVHE